MWGARRWGGIGGGGRRQPQQLFVLMLAMHVFRYGIDKIPPVTLAWLAATVAVFFNVAPAAFRTDLPAKVLSTGRRIAAATTGLSADERAAYSVCASGGAVLGAPTPKIALLQLRRVTTSVFNYSNDYTMYYQLISFLSKAIPLEQRCGSEVFFLLLLVCTLLSTVVYAVVCWVLVNFTDPDWLPLGLDEYISPTLCVQGCVTVLFALKVLQLAPAGALGELQDDDDDDARRARGAGDAGIPLAEALNVLLQGRQGFFIEILWLVFFVDVSLLQPLSGVLTGWLMLRANVPALLRPVALALRSVRRDVINGFQQPAAAGGGGARR